MKKRFIVFMIVLVIASMQIYSWNIRLDGKFLKASYTAWETESGQVMVSLDELQPDMIDAYALDFDGWQITIVARGFGITAMVTSPEIRRDGFAMTFTDPPIIKDDTLWFPIESLATLMDCSVIKNSSRKSLTITSPETAASAEQLADIYVKRMTSVKNNAVYPRPEIAYFEDLLIPGHEGVLSARLYDPDPADRTTRSLYVNIHGGGYTVGSIASSDHVCRDIANRSGQRVLSIEYGMLPEYPFPRGWEDAYTAVLWAYEHAADLGIDPDRIFVGGDSAGATLANGVSMMARDRGVFTVAGQILAYPVVDLTASWAGFVFSDPADAENPYATGFKGDLANMPQTLLLIAENDGLRPQGEAYATALQDAGVDVDVSVVPGTNHGFLAVHAESREKIAQFISTTAE